MRTSRCRRAIVGCCGFALPQERLFAELDAVEVQQSFYQPPATSTAERWRARAGPRFTFAVKVWQLVTHEATSPTYRRLRERLAQRDLAMCGGLRCNRVTKMAWQRTLDVARALCAEVIVVQTPARFTPTRTNLNRLRRFFEWAERADALVAFEPRGDWDRRLVARLCRDLDLVHACDPFLVSPVCGPSGVAYLRLHGRPAYRYSYRYTDADLRELRALLPEWAHTTFAMFNNASMAQDAKRFAALLAS